MRVFIGDPSSAVGAAWAGLEEKSGLSPTTINMAAVTAGAEEFPKFYRISAALLYGSSSFAIIVVNKIVLTTYK